MPSPFAEVLSSLRGTFESLELEWYVFGAQAALVHGAVRMTADVDVTVFPDELTMEALVEALIFHATDSEVAVIDPGPDIDRHLLAIVDAIGSLTPTAVIATHTHSDHAPLANPLGRRLGVSRAAAYRHFEDKTALLVAVAAGSSASPPSITPASCISLVMAPHFSISASNSSVVMLMVWALETTLFTSPIRLMTMLTSTMRAAGIRRKPLVLPSLLAR